MRFLLRNRKYTVIQVKPVYFFFLLILQTRIVVIQVVNKNIVVTILKTKITSFTARNKRAFSNMSIPNMSNIYCRDTCTTGPCTYSDHKSILSKPLLQKRNNISGSRYMSMKALTIELMYYLPIPTSQFQQYSCSLIGDGSQRKIDSSKKDQCSLWRYIQKFSHMTEVFEAQN